MGQAKNENQLEISPEKLVFKVGLLCMEVDVYKEKIAEHEVCIKGLIEQVKDLELKLKGD